MNDDLEQRVAVMKREIDALQITVTGQSKPWYQNVATLLSIIALFFSFGTTYVSYRRTNVQDIQSARQELRGLLQRLAALPKENMEAWKKYENDPEARNFVGGLVNQEMALLARNAAELAKKIPVEWVSAAEYLAIAYALKSSYDVGGANEFLGNAIKTSTDFNTEIAALRMVADMKFIGGQPDAGRVEYQKALAIFSKYPHYDSFVQASTHVQTELAWAYSEAGSNALPLATQHLGSAEAIVAPLPLSPGVEKLKSDIAQARSRIQSGPPTIPGLAP